MNDMFPTAGAMPPPKPHQVRALEQLRAGVRAGHKNQLLNLATGGGKTYIAMMLSKEALAKGKRVVFVADRTTLINQTSETADRYGLSDHGIIQADHERTDRTRPFQIASAQTLVRRQWPDADLILVDECHTQLKAWVEHIPTCRGVVVGLTATPFSKGLGKLFTNVVNGATAHELTEAGVLVPMRVSSCVRADMAGAETVGGEWTARAAAERGDGIIGDVVLNWIQHGENRKTILFAPTIAQCEEYARQFNAAGVNAALFTSWTNDDERKFLLDDFRKPDARNRVLISVDALAKGFDVPDVSCVIDARPLRKSLSTAIQMWGRGLRSAPGKTDCKLFDHSGNILRFAEDFTELFFNGISELDSGEKLDAKIRPEPEERESKGCPSCGYRPFTGRCMACGHTVQRDSLIEVQPGVMVDIQIGRSKQRIQREDLWAQACSYARMHSAPEKQPGRAANIYREIAGVWPKGLPSFSTMPDVPVSNAVLNQIKRANIAFARARKAA